MSQYQGNSSSSHGSISGPVKYGELIVLGYNGRLPNRDEARTSNFALCQRSSANALKPSTQHNDCSPAAAETIVMMSQHSMSFRVTPTSTVVVEYVPDTDTDMFQFGRSTEKPIIDFVVRDTTVPDDKSVISRFACRITCQRSPPYITRIYAAGFDSSKNIFLGEKALKWKRPDGRMDGLTTNGVLVKHPLHGFTQDSKANLWREISVCGNAFTQRENASAQRGEMVDGDSQELVDGSLIDLCGVTILWRTAKGLALTPTIRNLDALHKDLPRRHGPHIPNVVISPPPSPALVSSQQLSARRDQSAVHTEKGTRVLVPSPHSSHPRGHTLHKDLPQSGRQGPHIPNVLISPPLVSPPLVSSQQLSARRNQSAVHTEQGTRVLVPSPHSSHPRGRKPSPMEGLPEEQSSGCSEQPTRCVWKEASAPHSSRPRGRKPSPMEGLPEEQSSGCSENDKMISDLKTE